MPETQHQRFYHLTTFGCQMNEHDSERIRGVLEEDGWSPVDDPGDADLLVYNTCAVRGSAESRLVGRLGEASRLKRERPGRLVALGGCFAQSRKEEIFADLSFLDVAFGPENIGELPSLLREAGETATPSGAFAENSTLSASLPSRRASGYHAWVQVMTGCTNFCSYCVVPYVRGPEQSRPAAEVLDEVRQLAGGGVKEVTLLGQNVNAYGLDAAPGTGHESFPELLAMLDDIPGLERIRFTTSHPKDLSSVLIEAIRDLPKVCEHLHLPVQSGSTRILERMKRMYTRDQYLDLVERLYGEIPGISLTTDVIVGFPGEREDDFYRTMTLVESCRFDGAFTFRYSPRRGTEAAGMPGLVPDVTLKRRMTELVEITQRIAAENNASLVGEILEVMVEGPSRREDGRYRGRTRTNKIVNFETGGAAPAAGGIVRVKIDSSTSTTLGGRQQET